MKIIPLTQGKVALVDDDDYERLSQYCWCNANKYAIRREGPRNNRVTVWMHKDVLQTNETVDHIDNDTYNNQKSNLRIVDKSKNSMNRGLQSNNTTGFKGVSVSKGKFQAYIKFMGRKINLGTFDNPVQAALIYDAMARQLFGEFAQTNFPG